MRVLTKILPVSLLPILALLLGVAQAQTPTPTAAPPATATPLPPQPATFVVIPWVDAQNTGRELTAKIGETVCGTGVPSTGAGARPNFSVSVPSEEVLPGCGRQGAIVTFFVDGRQARQTAVWRPGGQVLSVIVGPPFARFSAGSAQIEQTVRAGGRLVPYVGDTACGYGTIVYSNEQEAGCGVEGSQVTFKLLDAQGNVVAVANEKGTWHAWDGLSDPQQVNLTFGPAGGIAMPNTGTGDGPDGEGSVWSGLSVLLGFASLTGAATGLALRRRATTR